MKEVKAKCFYEMNYINELSCLLDSFKHFLKYNKYIHSQNRENFNKFIEYLMLLIRLSENPRDSKAKYYLKNLLNENFIESRHWLVDKFDSICNN